MYTTTYIITIKLISTSTSKLINANLTQYAIHPIVIFKRSTCLLPIIILQIPLALLPENTPLADTCKKWMLRLSFAQPKVHSVLYIIINGSLIIPTVDLSEYRALIGVLDRPDAGKEWIHQMVQLCQPGRHICQCRGALPVSKKYRQDF